MLAAWLCSLFLAHAEPPPVLKDSILIEAENSTDCILSADGTTLGKLPIRTEAVLDGHHRFSISCPDGRKAETERDVTLIHGGVARLFLDKLSYSAPTPEKVTGPIPTYIVVRDFPNKKVRIDGGPPVPLPHLTTLTVGVHTFIVIDANGQPRPPVTREVVSKQGQAVINLD